MVSFRGTLVLLLTALTLNVSAETASRGPAKLQKVHKNVQAALDWQIPPNPCQEPKAPRGLNILALGGTFGHQPTSTTEDSADVPTVYDVDHYQIDRYKRARKRWESCVSKYKSGLLQEFETLKNSAQHGLTRAQADAIAGKLLKIQEAVMSPDGMGKRVE